MLNYVERASQNYECESINHNECSPLTPQRANIFRPICVPTSTKVFLTGKRPITEIKTILSLYNALPELLIWIAKVFIKHLNASACRLTLTLLQHLSKHCAFLSDTVRVKNIDFLERHTDSSLSLSFSPSAKTKQCSLAAVCVVNRHLQTPVGGNRPNALPAVSPVELSLWLKIPPPFPLAPRRPQNLSRPAAEGSRCYFSLSLGIEIRGQRQRGGLKRRRFIWFLDI